MYVILFKMWYTMLFFHTISKSLYLIRLKSLDLFLLFPMINRQIITHILSEIRSLWLNLLLKKGHAPNAILFDNVFIFHSTMALLEWMGGQVYGWGIFYQTDAVQKVCPLFSNIKATACHSLVKSVWISFELCVHIISMISFNVTRWIILLTLITSFLGTSLIVHG